ncbi:phosphotransferase family protein [Frankia sp. CIT1]|uniref:phosphotransferase family protein n=2 Tax=Frankia TaxID=1854 RepID=UPI001EF465AE|nr:phosphotransferase family protein [Frankia sp. CIT1]
MMIPANAVPADAIPTGLDLAALTAYFDVRVPGRCGQLRAALLAGGRSNLTYRVWDEASSWVVRRPPLGGLTPSAHDMSREFRVVAALAGTDVPVPDAIALCEDSTVIGAPFSVVSLVDGVVIRSREDLDSYSNAQVAQAAFGVLRALARLHAVPYAEVGLADFGRPEGYLSRQVTRWRNQWAHVATRELTDIITLHARLRDALPAESGAAIVHGDVRIDNAILDPDSLGTVRALVDWEMATLGDPLADLALAAVYRDPAFEAVLGGSAASTSNRMPAADELIEAYALAAGRNMVNLSFYLALGYFKIAVIAEGIHARYLGGKTVGDGFETAGAAVPELVAAGLRALRALR